MALPVGTWLGPYEVLAPLGAGGMGEVYRARDTRLGREVAIKVLPAERMADEGRRRRFAKDARAAHFMVMEYVRGRRGTCLRRREGRSTPGATSSASGRCCTRW